MDGRLKYDEALQIVHKKIDEYIEHWNNDQSIDRGIKTSIIDILNELKQCYNLRLIGYKAINEYDKINSNEKIMGRLNNDMKERSMGVFWGQIYKLRVLIKNMNVPTREIISNSFKNIVMVGKIGDGWKNVIKKDDMYVDVPEIAYEHIINGGKGNSFIFASSLVKLLHENGVKCEIIAANGPWKKRYAVMYTDENIYEKKVRYIADPYAEIKELTKRNINSESSREEAYTEKIEEIEKMSPNYVDNSRLTVMDFLGENDFVWVVGNPYEETQTSIDTVFTNIDKKILVKNYRNKEKTEPHAKQVITSSQNNEDR